MADQGETHMQEVVVECMTAVELTEEQEIGTVEELIEGQGMVAFHNISDQIQEEIVLQPQEEIVGEDHQSVLVGDDGLVYIDSIPVPAPDIDLSTVSRTIKTKKSPKKQTLGLGARNQVVVTAPEQLQLYGTSGGGASVSGISDKKWEQKQFQIKTTDGEFSVTMWAAGELSNLGLTDQLSCKLMNRKHDSQVLLHPDNLGLLLNCYKTKARQST